MSKAFIKKGKNNYSQRGKVDYSERGYRNKPK